MSKQQNYRDLRNSMQSPLPVLPLKNTVVYPNIVMPLAVGRERSLAAVKACGDVGQQIIVVAQRDGSLDAPSFDDLYPIATLADITRVEQRDQGLQVIVQGKQRIRLLPPQLNAGVANGEPDFLRLEAEQLNLLDMQELGASAVEVDALLRDNLKLAEQIANLFDNENGSQVYQQLVGSIADPIAQMYRIASLANLTLAQQQSVLDADSTLELMQSIQTLLQHEVKVTQVRRDIAEQAREDLDQQQREHVLRQQKRTIEQALGEGDDDEDISELKNQLTEAKLPEAVQKEVDRELKRLARMQPSAPDYQVGRSYLELVAELPWHAQTEDKLDLGNAQEVLDHDHYGLDDVKERIIETLAVMQLNPDAKAPILCLVGPPGVGKTSLGESIARAMGRKFERLSLGGLHDEAELRGHRRTYIGAMPGRILQALRRAEVVNPIIMLDELDKLGQDFRGDPSAALMEILDPAQNDEFRDNFLNLPYDLSRVMFITTANTLDTVPRPLLDRMEVLELSGYSDAEKNAIATQYLAPRQRQEKGLSDAQLILDAKAIFHLIRSYTREAGVRELERVIGRLARKRARQVVEARSAASPGETKAFAEIEQPLDLDAITGLLGPERFKEDPRRRDLKPGVATGMAWTAVGGDVMYIEANLTAAGDKLTLTGQLGSVMQESAQAARSYVYSNARPERKKDKTKGGKKQSDWSLTQKQLDKRGIHIHVPAGAIPKDGPSAGVTMAVAITSAYSGKPVRDDLAMTGEITLTGLVLPVGGIKEKLLAAHRSGMRRIILPRDNAADLVKMPASVMDALDVTLVSHLDEVLPIALGKQK